LGKKTERVRLKYLLDLWGGQEKEREEKIPKGGKKMRRLMGKRGTGKCRKAISEDFKFYTNKKEKKSARIVESPNPHACQKGKDEREEKESQNSSKQGKGERDNPVYCV